MSSSPSHASVANYTNSSNAVTIIKGQKCLNKPDSRWGFFSCLFKQRHVFVSLKFSCKGLVNYHRHLLNNSGESG